MAEDDREVDFSVHQLPSQVTLSPFTPIPTSLNPRRLSTHLSKPTSPVRTGRKKPALAWVSLQGRLLGADEATSARAIGGCLTPQQALAWELFSPIHRVLIVAVVAAAVVKSEKNRQIRQLKDAVQLRVCEFFMPFFLGFWCLVCASPFHFVVIYALVGNGFILVI